MEITIENLKQVKEDIFNKYLTDEYKEEKKNKLSIEVNKLMLKLDSVDSKEEVEYFE